MSHGNIILEAYCLLITISLQISNMLATRKTKKTRKNRILCAMIFSNAVVIITFIIVVLIDGMEELSWLNQLTTGICYACGAVLTELFGEYVLTVIQRDETRYGWRIKLLRSVCTVAMILDIISIFNGMYFSTVNGFHVRGPYYTFNQSLILLIMLAEMIYVLFRVKKLGKDAVALTMYGLIPAVATVLQIFVEEYVLLYPAITLSLFIIYIVSYINQTDELNQKNDELQDAVVKIEQAKKSAEKANQAKSDFLSSMSHDIRTPLNAIIGMTDMAIENIDHKKQALDNLAVVQSSSRHLLSLVNDVLDLSMIESGKIKIDETEFILPDLLIETERIAWPLTKAKNQEFILSADDVYDEFYIGDMPRLKQILVNFLSNAVKYTPSGGRIILKIEEDRSPDGKTAMLKMSCIDNGIGIDKKVQNNIFQPFVREVKTTVNPVEGTGLGLAIVHNIVEAMHGTVSLVSEKGAGSTFTAEVPLKIADEAKMLEQFNDVRSYFVLFIADDQKTCDFVKESYPKLIGNPCDIARSQDVLDGTFQYQDHYDAVITISEKNMVEVIRRLKQVFPDTDVICGCNMDMLDREDMFLDAGADAVLYRPAFRVTLFEQYQELKLKKNTTAGTDRYLQGKNILVAEDQAINYMIIEHMLKNAGASVWKAENGIDAVDMFMGSKQGKYDVIMMDIMMPVMDGYTATMKIRNSGRPDAKTIPIIAMTANAFAEDIQKSKDYGMNAHISKPLEPDVVKETLLRIFSSQSAE